MGKTKTKLYGDIPGVLLGAGCMTIMCLGGLVVLTQLILSGKAGEESANLYALVLLFLSALVGSQISSSTAERKLVGTVAGAAVFVLLLIITGLAMEGAFSRVLPCVGSVAAGSAVSCVLCLKKKEKGQHRKRHNR